MYLTQTQLGRCRAVRKTVARARRNADRLEADPDLQEHYKAPCFWASVGDPAMAGQCCRRIERFLQADGTDRRSLTSGIDDSGADHFRWAQLTPAGKANL